MVRIISSGHLRHHGKMAWSIRITNQTLPCRYRSDYLAIINPLASEKETWKDRRRAICRTPSPKDTLTHQKSIRQRSWTEHAIEAKPAWLLCTWIPMRKGCFFLFAQSSQPRSLSVAKSGSFPKAGPWIDGKQNACFERFHPSMITNLLANRADDSENLGKWDGLEYGVCWLDELWMLESPKPSIICGPDTWWSSRPSESHSLPARRCVRMFTIA